MTTNCSSCRFVTASVSVGFMTVGYRAFSCALCMLLYTIFWSGLEQWPQLILIFTEFSCTYRAPTAASKQVTSTNRMVQLTFVLSYTCVGKLSPQWHEWHVIRWWDHTGDNILSFLTGLDFGTKKIHMEHLILIMEDVKKPYRIVLVAQCNKCSTYSLIMRKLFLLLNHKLHQWASPFTREQEIKWWRVLPHRVARQHKVWQQLMSCLLSVSDLTYIKQDSVVKNNIYRVSVSLLAPEQGDEKLSTPFALIHSDCQQQVKEPFSNSLHLHAVKYWFYNYVWSRCHFSGWRIKTNS